MGDTARSPPPVPPVLPGCNGRRGRPDEDHVHIVVSEERGWVFVGYAASTVPTSTSTAPRPDSQMSATASGVVRPEEVSPAPSAPASSCMGTRAEELMARLAAAGPFAGAGGEEVEHERVRALREIKNQIISNRTKKLL